MIVDDFMNEEITKDIIVDDALTSSIIGPKGSRIKAVRSKTAASIKIGNICFFRVFQAYIKLNLNRYWM